MAAACPCRRAPGRSARARPAGRALNPASPGAGATVFSGYTVLCTAADGSIDSDERGLFHRDTRLLSHYRLRVAGSVPELVAASQAENDHWDGVLRVPRPGGRAEGPQLPQDALEVRVSRRVGPGLAEAIEVRNWSAVPCDTTLELELDADFSDVLELGRDRVQRGRIERRADGPGRTLEVAYRVEHDGRSAERGLRVHVQASDSPPEIEVTRIRFAVHLEPREAWAASLVVAVRDGDAWATPQPPDHDSRGRQRAAWRRARPTVEGPDRLARPFGRAADDLFDLRNWELEERFLGSTDGSRWILNAGEPRFTGLFGRDVATAGYQAALLGPRALLGALEALAASRATSDDPWRDAEPGKLIHELRSGPLSELRVSPRDAYYGSQTTPAMFLLALTEAWHWTGDIGLLRRYRDVAMQAVTWAERHGDLDGDGFLEYEKRSPQGLRNQAWKDSDEAIRHADGSIVDGPIATVDEQAFNFIALERMAEILVALGEDERAEELLDRADALRRRWHDAFWMADEQFYALALDATKRQVRSITSNPGHALGAGIVPSAHAPRVADRLLAPDLFSGWGIRTLSGRHPSYNPFAYHLGAVWPVEQATFALGFKRYGLDQHADRLVSAVLGAASELPDGRLPEALSGHGRGEIAAPVPYPQANSPQAWSASAVIQMVQIMLGLYPFAPLRALAVVRPRLPAWLPEVTLRAVRVGRAKVDLQFRRRADGSASWRVARLRGPLLVFSSGPPQAGDDAPPSERLAYAALRSMPGRLVRAGRIALGLWS